jgi:magnesium transporter
MSETKFFHFPKSGKLYNIKTAEEAISKMHEGFIWLDYFKPEKDELMELASSLGLHPLSVEDCINDIHLPKMDLFPDHSFIIFNSLTYIEKTLYIDEIGIFIGKNFIISVSGHNSDGRRPLNDIIKKVENDPASAKAGPAFISHIILDFVVDQVINAFESLEDELDAAEDEILTDPKTFNASGLIHARKDLVLMRKSLFHEREILVRISRGDCPFIPEKTIIHFRDIYDHLTKFFELAETYRDVLTSLLELYTSLLNNIMTRSANQTNASVRRLTLITTIFMPLTLIASIGGMSEWTMITGAGNWKTSYPLFIVGLLVIGIASYFLIKKLERGDRDEED